MKKFLSILLLYLIVFPNNSYSQYYDIGQDPASIKWKQIKTANFQIIFPDSFHQEANRLANLMEYTKSFDCNSLNSNPKKISIILHTETVESNAMVVWAPKRMEFYSNPPQNTYGQDWLEQLAIHEYRHVVQIEKLRKSFFSKCVNIVFGEQATGGILGVFVPQWFMEGDAVYAETALSKTGRGRLPDFYMELRTQWLSDKKYSYDKAVFGSYKNYIPDHYQLGYQLVSYARKKYGNDVWNKSLENVSKFPFMITPFNHGIRKTTGLNKTQLYKKTLNYLDGIWRKEDNEISFSPVKVLTSKGKKEFSNYINPQFIDENTIVAEKSGLDHVGQFISIDNSGEEKKLFIHGSYFGESLSAKNNLFIWSEKSYDKRWDSRSYAVIKKYDFISKKKKNLTKKSRYFAPELSNDSKKIVAIEVDNQSKFSIVILDSENGKVIKKIKSPNNLQIITPSWSKDDREIVFIALTDLGKSIMTVNLETQIFESIIPPSFDDISTPKFHKNYIVFNASYSGITNIFAIDVSDKKPIYQITSSRFGTANFDFSEDGNEIIYSDYSPQGYDIVKAKFSPENSKIFTKPEIQTPLLADDFSKTDSNIIDFKNAPKIQYSEKPYRKSAHLINIHSWAPLYIDANTNSIRPGVSVMSQNKLSTAFTKLGYDYDLASSTGKYIAEYIYKGFLPVIGLRYENGKRAGHDYYENRFTYDTESFILSVSLPLNLSKGKFFRGIEPKISYSNTKFKHNNTTPQNFINGTNNVMAYQIYSYNQVRSSTKDFKPKWGQAIQIKYKHTPFSGNDLGSLFSFESSFYFPGIFKNNSLKLSGIYQIRNGKDYTFGDSFYAPRGFYSSAFSKKKIKMISIDYAFPLFYPDLNIGSLIFIKRIKANFFYDYNFTKKFDILNGSRGIEITSDLHVLRTIAPIEIGIQIAQTPKEQRVSLQLIFNINFDQLGFRN
ncbi:MAG: hypothetical protein HXX09_13300 [Bacteroidetes bacterium]|nr:hypothetical protein [Bacteroidota bacterium]